VSATLDILLLDNSHLPAVGGKEIVVHHLARQLQGLGHRVTVAGPGGAKQHKNLDLGYPVKRFPASRWVSADMRWSVIRSLIFKANRYDIVHAHTTHPSGYHALRWLRSNDNSTPLVVTPHGIDIHKIPEQQWGKRLDPKLDKKIRWLLERCDATTAISDSVYSSLLDAGAIAERIHRIPNGVDTARMQADTGIDIRKHFGIPKASPLFATIGNYKPIKGHAVIVDALSTCTARDAHLVIVGSTSADFVAQTKSGPSGDRVTFTGPLDFPVSGGQKNPDILAALLQQCTAYISGSISEGAEGLSLALLEAIAAGACPIATDISGNRDLIKHQRSGLIVKPDHPQNMSDAFDYLADNPDQTKAMAATAQQSITHMSWREVAKKYIALYEELRETKRQAIA